MRSTILMNSSSLIQFFLSGEKRLTVWQYMQLYSISELCFDGRVLSGCHNIF